MEFRILETNQEHQYKETFEKLREMKRSLRARSTKLVNDEPGGLNKESAIELIHEAAATGNQQVKVSGDSTEGVHYTGDNSAFSVSVPVSDLPQNDAERAARLVHLYQDQVERGILSEDASSDADDEIRRLREKRRPNG